MSKNVRDCFVFLVLLSLIISGCSSPVSEGADAVSTKPVVSPQPHFTQTMEPGVMPTSTSTPVLVSTLKSYPTPISVFDYPNQSTDGVLLFSVEKIMEKCYKVGEPIQLKFVFRNLTDITIKIPGDFAIAINQHGVGGNILPFIMLLDGEIVYSYKDLILDDSFWAQSDEYVAVSGNQQVDAVLTYTFPDFVVHPPITQTYDFVTPSPGRYSLRFVYFRPDRGIDAWSGAIGSNQVELCITN